MLSVVGLSANHGTVVDNGNGTYTTYDYDAAGQLKTLSHFRADGTVNSRFAYTYDALGRRDTVTTLEGKTS